jgi:hypothetical protein
MYPRESGYTGKEVGARITSPMDVHVSGEVALCIQKYYLATGDVGFILEKGFQVVSNIAKFINSRTNLRLDSHFYHFEKVIGPDSTHFNVDDDAYTNAVSSIVLHIAHRLIDQFAYCYPHFASFMAPHWEDVADNVHMPYLHEELRHDAYIGYVDDRIRYPSVPAIHYPLQFLKRTKLVNKHIYKDLSMDQIRTVIVNDLQFYQKSLARNEMTVESDFILANAWLDASRMFYDANKIRQSRELANHAKSVFDSVSANVVGPFHVWFDTKGFHMGHYLPGAGSFIQALLHGFGGVRAIEDFDNIVYGDKIENGLVIAPLIIDQQVVLPAGVNSIEFKNIHYQGYHIIVEIHKTNGVSVTCMHQSPFSSTSIRLLKRLRSGSSDTLLDCHERSVVTIPINSGLESLVLISTQAPLNNTCTRGVSPDKQLHYYQESTRKQFKCLNSAKTIPFDAVNDGYCDCQDGSDEPGTDACMKGRFYCPFSSKDISTGFVNDRICDCCDGSDEWATDVKCKPFCADEKREEELKLRQEREEKALASSRTSYFVVFVIVLLHVVLCGGIISYLLCGQNEKDKIM